MNRRRLAALPALLLLAPLAACGDDGSAGTTDSSSAATESPEPSDSASDDSTEPEDTEDTEDTEDAEAEEPLEGDIVGETFAFEVPAGWVDGSERFQAFDERITAGAIARKPVDGFAANVNVIADAGLPDVPLDEAEPMFLKSADANADDVELLPRVEIDDVESAAVVGRTPIGGTRVWTTQFLAYEGDQSYVITFSHGATSTEQQRRADIDLVLDSWQWGAGSAA